MILSIYWQVGSHRFISFDDESYVTNNRHVLEGLTRGSVLWAFTSFEFGNWHPLTWLSHMLDVECFGADPGWHHRMNVLFHLLNTELLFLVLWRMTGEMWKSTIVAALFAIHPLHVESVAWVAERKDLLSAFFSLLTIAAYLGYVRRPGIARYLLVTAGFATALLCKPMAVTLPFVLLLLDLWPLYRVFPEERNPGMPWKSVTTGLVRLLPEKIPLLALSAVSSAITITAQSDAISILDGLSFGIRLSNALASYVLYLGKTVWPASLSVFYPHPVTIEMAIPTRDILGAVLFLCAASVLAIRKIGDRPYWAVGWFWYLGTLIPVVGLVQAGAAAMADRYTYVPLIGVFIAAVWGVSGMIPERPGRCGIAIVLGGVMLVLSIISWKQAGYWVDSATLFSRAVAVTERNWLALDMLGQEYDRAGAAEQAIKYYQQAIQTNPDFAGAWYNLGVANARLGRYPKAIEAYQEAIRLRPDLPAAWNNLGGVYGNLGLDREAAEHFRESVRLNPENPDGWNNLGRSFENRGRYREAADAYREALRLGPDSAEIWINLGVSNGKLGRSMEAEADFREAVRIKPDFAIGWNNLGVAQASQRQFSRAIDSYREAIRLKPDHFKSWNNLGMAYAGQGQYRKACDAYREALRIQPDFAEARRNLEVARSRGGDTMCDNSRGAVQSR